MDRFSIGNFSRRENGWYLEIAFTAGWRADADGLVGKLHMETVLIGGGVDGNCLDAHLLAGANDAKCDLTPVGNQYLFKHLEGTESFLIMNSGWSYSTGCASVAMIFCTVPLNSASISFMIFRASTIQSVSPSSTRLPPST